MTDPEVTYKDLVTGDPRTLTGHVETLSKAGTELDTARSDLVDAAGVPVWVGGAANAFTSRVISMSYGISSNREIVSRVQGALFTAVSAYESMESRADSLISQWRNRAPNLPAVVEEISARLFNGALVGLGRDYNEQLTAIKAVLRGEEVDLDDLDKDTREWVEKGMAKNDDWVEDTNGELGPLIPNTLATGDDRGLTPQGLGYDPHTRSLLQAYYKEGDSSVLSVIDEVTGKELTEVKLGAAPYDDTVPGHVGGVTVDGDHVYITDSGRVYEYSLKDIRAASPGEEVPQTRLPQSVDAHSYTAFHNGKLYVGDHYENRMFVYEKDPFGNWQKVTDADGEDVVIDTPDKVQGVMVRDGEFVFSSSSGRMDESSLVVQDRDTGERSDPYTLPNMSQSVVEVDGNFYVTYESGGSKFDEPTTGNLGWFWGVPDSDSLWAMQHMTKSPLSDLGLEPEFEVEPATLRTASADLGDAGSTLEKQGKQVDAIQISSSSLGSVPAASGLASSLNKLLDTSGKSLKTGSKAVTNLSEGLWNTGNDYDSTDLAVQRAFKKLRS